MQKKNRNHMYSSFYFLARQIPIERVLIILDCLTEMILSTQNSDNRWYRDHHDGWCEFTPFIKHMISRQLEYDKNAVSIQQLWNWLTMLKGSSFSETDDEKAIAEKIKNDKRLRQGIQRLVLFKNKGEEGFPLGYFYLSNLSKGLLLTEEDFFLYLTEVTYRKDPLEEKCWKLLVNNYRGDNGIPKKIQNLAMPYAIDKAELIDFLTKKSKPDEWEVKQRQRKRDYQSKIEKKIEKTRKEFSDHIVELREGELDWIYNPALGYFGMFHELKNDLLPSERLKEWLGDELCDAALQGFEAVLYRDDIPTAKQVSENYADSKSSHFVYPMLAGACQMVFEKHKLSSLKNDTLSALAIAASHEGILEREPFNELRDLLEKELHKDSFNFEEHLRLQFEPMLKAKHKYISGLYQFARQDKIRPLSTKLCLEWLENFISLPVEIERELSGHINSAKKQEENLVAFRMISVIKKRIEKLKTKGDRGRFWVSLFFLYDFESATKFIPKITDEEKNWLWVLIDTFYSRYDGCIVPGINQLKWLVSSFRGVWPYTSRPSGTTSGSKNCWNATEFLDWAILQIAKSPSSEAAHALEELKEMQLDGYTQIIQAAIASQHQVRIEDIFKPTSLVELKAALNDTAPQSALDVQLIVLDQLLELQKRLSGDPLNIVNNFYTDNGIPRTENECRDQMLILLGKLPFNIQSPKEVAMPQERRSDSAFSYGDIIVPLEAKGQWHKDVWFAAESQLDKYYSIHHKAASKGIYIIFWFGLDVQKGRKLKKPPKGIAKPLTADEMQSSLQGSLSIERRSDIKIVVLDLTKP